MSNDEFGDIKGSLAGKNGIFALSDGLDTLDSVTKKFDSEGRGMVYNSQCNHCGAPQEILVEWPELAAISQKRVVDGWYVDRANGLFRPNMRCRSCQAAVIPWGETPAGARKDLEAGVEAYPQLGPQVHRWIETLRAMPQPR
jgi:hypothetical protein